MNETCWGGFVWEIGFCSSECESHVPTPSEYSHRARRMFAERHGDIGHVSLVLFISSNHTSRIKMFLLCSEGVRLWRWQPTFCQSK